MTRKEEILQVANENYSGYSERRLGFIAGANWADKTMLNYICEYLSIYYPNIDKIGIDKFIIKFRKMVEGGAK